MRPSPGGPGADPSWRRALRQVGVRDRSHSPRLLTSTMVFVAGVLMTQSLVSYLTTGFPAYTTVPMSLVAAVGFIVALPIALLLWFWWGQAGWRKRPPGLPAMLVGVSLVIVSGYLTGDASVAPTFILFCILVAATYQLRPAGAWLMCSVILVADAALVLALHGPLAAWFLITMSTPIAAAITYLTVDVRNRQERLHAELVALARLDALTGTANRAALVEAAEQALAVSQSGVGLLLLDLDNFKEVNDTLGHHVGDDALKHYAGILRECAGPFDLVARLGGDEFAVLITDAWPARAHAAGELLLEELAGRPFRCPIDTRSMGLVSGIGVAHQRGGGFTSLYEAADASLYATKRGTAVDVVPRRLEPMPVLEESPHRGT